MRNITLAIFASLLVATPAFAETPVREQDAGPSGRPGKVLTQAECDTAWKLADTSQSGNVSGDPAKKFVSNMKEVDTDKDGKISATEFKAGCAMGWVQQVADTMPADSMKNQTK